MLMRSREAVHATGAQSPPVRDSACSAGWSLAWISNLSCRLQRQRRWAGRRLVCALRLDDRAHATFRIARCRGLGAAAENAEELGGCIVRNIIPAHVVIGFFEVG